MVKSYQGELPLASTRRNERPRSPRGIWSVLAPAGATRAGDVWEWDELRSVIVRAAVSGRSRWSRARYQILTAYIADWELDRVEAPGKAHAASDGDQRVHLVSVLCRTTVPGCATADGVEVEARLVSVRSRLGQCLHRGLRESES